MDTAIIVVPTLYRHDSQTPLPPRVLSLHPGLPQAPHGTNSYLPDNYPLTPGQAQAVLAEMLALGETLTRETLHASARGLDGPHGLSPAEHAALKQFASAAAPASGLNASAGGASQTADAEQLAQNRLSAYKSLLLAWDLEKRRQEILALHARVLHDSQALATALSGEEHENMAEALARLQVIESNDIPEPAWQLSLAAIAAFLPDNAMLYTDHAAMIACLREENTLAHAPGGMYEALGLAAPGQDASLLCCTLPLWRLIGHSKAPRNRPWLLRTLTVLASAP